jgi:osmotically-inducible protein OsmY
MKQGIYKRAMVLALTGAATVTSGCVVVVGGDRANPQAEVEWARPSGHGNAGAPSSANGSLAREVEARIRMDSALAGEDISAASNGNVVTLHGRVSDVSRLEHVMRVAADVPGVTRVVSRLTVEMEGG